MVTCAASGAIARYILESPKFAKATQRARASSARSRAREFVIAPARIADRRFVDLFVPVNFAATGITVIGGKAKSDALSEADSVATDTAACSSRAPITIDHLNSAAAHLQCEREQGYPSEHK